MKKAIICGSFDPITKGHEDIIRRACALFDEVYVCVLDNSEKTTVFTGEQRLEIIKPLARQITEETGTAVHADMYSGLTSDYMKKNGIKWLVRGVRNASDFDYENGMAKIMQTFLPEAETVLLPASSECMHISSTYARELIKYGCDLEGALPKICISTIKEYIK